MLFQLVLIQVVTFVAIVLVLRKLLYAETARETQRLRMLTEENYRKEKELSEKMKGAETAYAERMARAEEDARKLKEEAEKETSRMRKDVLDKARAESERIIKEAVNARDKMRDEIENELREKTPALATQIFRDFLSEKVKVMTHRELVKEVIDELKKAEKSRFNVKIKKGELIFAIPFVKEEKKEILRVLSGKLGGAVDFEEKEDRNLVAGVVIKLGALVIDGSLENRLRQLEKR